MPTEKHKGRGITRSSFIFLYVFMSAPLSLFHLPILFHAGENLFPPDLFPLTCLMAPNSDLLLTYGPVLFSDIKSYRLPP